MAKINTTISIETTIKDSAKAANINISKICEEALSAAVSEKTGQEQIQVKKPVALLEPMSYPEDFSRDVSQAKAYVGKHPDNVTFGNVISHLQTRWAITSEKLTRILKEGF